jgi:translocation and assembly module TamA
MAGFRREACFKSSLEGVGVGLLGVNVAFVRVWAIRHSLVLAVIAVLASAPAPAEAAWRDWWPFGKKAEAPVPDPFPYTATLEVVGGDRKIEKTLSRASTLMQRQDLPPSGLMGLLARARQDVGQLTAILYENAFYAGQIAITINGRRLEEIGPFDSIGAEPATVHVGVVTGQPFVFGAVGAEPRPKGFRLEKLGMIRGELARSTVVLAAERALVDAWQQRGHPLARALPRDTIADHRTGTLDVTLNVDPGPQANYGRVEVSGASGVDPNLIVGRAGFRPVPYSSKAVRAAETRLRDLGVFESVRIGPGEALDPDGTIPMKITVAVRKRRVIGGSANYSNTDGLGAESYWRNRNLFGGAEQLHLSASISNVISDTLDPDFRLLSRFVKPGIFDPMTDLILRAEGYRETTEAYRVTAIEGEVGFSHIFSDTVSGSTAVELSRSQTVDDEDVERDHLILALPTQMTWDTRDNRLDPTRGFKALAFGEPAYDFYQDKAFATFSGDFSTYKSFTPTNRFVLAGRIAATVLTVDDIEDVAPDKRIYLGGAGTVRGYGYQNIAPRDNNGDIVGGRSSVLVSGEVRYRATDTIGVVGFVDAGTVSSSMLPDFNDIKVGIGAGLRYLTPVGPIRFDVAVPLQPEDGDPAVAIYVGLGQAF